MVHSQSLFHLFLSFRTVQLLKNLAASGIQTWIVRAVGENADHNTTTMALQSLILAEVRSRATVSYKRRDALKIVSFRHSPCDIFCVDTYSSFNLSIDRSIFIGGPINAFQILVRLTLGLVTSAARLTARLIRPQECHLL